MPRSGIAILIITGALVAEEGPPPAVEAPAAQVQHQADPIAPLPWIQAYEPIYLLFGGHPVIAKFQVSMKSRIFNPTWGTPRDGRTAEGLYFGYSQTTFWDLESESRPFTDSSYRPEFFWVQDDPQPDWLGGRAELSWQTGLRHESNGQADPESRSFNIVYLKPTLTWRWQRRRFLTVAPSAWVYVGDLSDNPDIADYRGYADLRLWGGKEDGLQGALLGRLGAGFDRGYLQADITFPLSRATAGYFRPLLHLQASVGYADSIDNYNEREDRLLVGFSFVR